MPTTPVLGISHIEQGQTQKEVTHNENIDQLASHIAQELEHDFSSDADYVLITSIGTEEHRNFHLLFTDTGGTLSADRNIIVPAEENRWMVTNETAYTLTVKTSAGLGVTVTAGQTKLVYCDGTDVIAGGNTAVDIVFFFPGKPAANSTALSIPMVQTLTFPDNMLASRANAGAVSASAKSFDLLINTSTFASVAFAVGASSGTFATTASSITFSPGDIFRVRTPTDQDATLQNVGFMLRAFE